MRILFISLIFTLLFSFPVVITAQNYTISGYITDETNGETLLGASVYDKLSTRGNATNNFGFYSLRLPKGNVAVNYSYVGYTPETKEFKLTKDTIINIGLKSNLLLDEVVITASQQSQIGVKGSQMSAIEIPVEQIKNIPTLFGENDLIKAIQLLPGVQSGSEGSAGLYVRGGGPDENLILLDGVPMYNVNHMFGFFSAFNTDAVKNVTLYKGSFPSRFGGRLSSVVDVHTKNGDDKKYHGNVSIGLISSKINVEGPIWKERTTFNVSLRRTYFDILSQPFIRMATAAENSDQSTMKVTAGYYFYDFNAKITHKISDKDRLYFSFYSGDDAIYTRMKSSEKYTANSYSSTWMKLGWDWGNMISALRWNRVITNRLFMNTTATFTRYRSNMKIGGVYEEQDKTKTPPDLLLEEHTMKYNSGIKDITLKSDFDYTPGSFHEIKFGVNYTNHAFSPDVSSMQASIKHGVIHEKRDTTLGSPRVKANEFSSYFEDNMNLTRWLKANVGVHYSLYNVQQHTYHAIEPRIGIRALAAENLSFKAGFAQMSQYIHLLSSANVSLPTDLWVPATKHILPMKSTQISAGVFYDLKKIANLSVEGYYKTMDNLIEYKDGASFMGVSAGWESKVVMGRGWAYGVEFLAQRSFGKTTGWLGYTWSKSERLFDKPGQELNFGRIFPAKYDRRHDISLTATHKFSEKIDLTGTWVYSTGNAGTLGMQYYPGTPDTERLSSGYYNGNDNNRLTYIEQRNNYRFNSYHRMDVGVNFHKKKKHGVRTWNISIYNAYNQRNPFMVYPSSVYDQKTGATQKVMKQVTLFPIIPSVSYMYKF